MPKSAIQILCIGCVLVAFCRTWRAEHQRRLNAERQYDEWATTKAKLYATIVVENNFLYLRVQNEGAIAKVWVELSDSSDYLRHVHAVWEEPDNIEAHRTIARGAHGTVVLGHVFKRKRTDIERQEYFEYGWTVLHNAGRTNEWAELFHTISDATDPKRCRLTCNVCSDPDSVGGNFTKILELSDTSVSDLDAGSVWTLTPSYPMDGS